MASSVTSGAGRRSSSAFTCSACHSASAAFTGGDDELVRFVTCLSCLGVVDASLRAAEKLSSPQRSNQNDAPESPSRRAKDNERPLVDDIRLLGRILGDVIREQEGDEAFDLVERMRQLSVAFRRDADLRPTRHSTAC